MRADHKHNLTLAGIIAGVSLVIGSFSAFINGAIELNRKVGVGAAAQDSLFHNDSLLFVRVAKLERLAGVKKGRLATPSRPRSEGLIRRVWGLLF